MSQPHGGNSRSKDDRKSSRYRYYIQPGGDEEVTVLNAQLAILGRFLVVF